MTELLPLATVSLLEKRLGVPVGSLANADLVRAQENLKDASELVRVETLIPWVDGVGVPNPPAAVVVVVLQVAKRVFLNPDGLTSESVGSYSWQTDQQSMGIYLTNDELRTVKAAAKMYLTGLGATGGWSGTGTIRTPSAYGYRAEIPCSSPDDVYEWPYGPESEWTP